MALFDWIKAFYFNRQEASATNSLQNLIPPIFDEYFVVHWKVGIIDNFLFEIYPEHNEAFDDINQRIKIERDFGLFLNPQKDRLFREISIAELAEKFNLTKNYLLLNQIKQTPAIQILKQKSLKALKKSLEKIAPHQNIHFFVEDIYNFPTDEPPRQEYQGIYVEEYLRLQENFNFNYATYLFSDNLEWCLITSEDYPMCLCVKNSAVQKIMDAFELEIFNVQYDEILYRGVTID